MKRSMGVDPGDARIGLALSDPLRLIASPLTVLKHVSREEDAAAILRIAEEHHVDTIVVGVAYRPDGEIGPQARKSMRLIEQLTAMGSLPVIPWDESGTTQAARRGAEKDPQIDARAAAYILQEYLDAQDF